MLTKLPSGITDSFSSKFLQEKVTSWSSSKNMNNTLYLSGKRWHRLAKAFGTLWGIMYKGVNPGSHEIVALIKTLHWKPLYCSIALPFNSLADHPNHRKRSLEVRMAESKGRDASRNNVVVKVRLIYHCEFPSCRTWALVQLSKNQQNCYQPTLGIFDCLYSPNSLARDLSGTVSGPTTFQRFSSCKLYSA